MADAIQPRALSPNQAARYLGLSRSSVYALLKRGALPSQKILNRRVILVSDLDKLLSEGGDQ